MEFLLYVLLAIYFLLIFYFSKDFLQLIHVQKPKVKLLFYFVCLFPGFVFLYILNDEKYIYFYDYSNYWLKSIHYRDSITNHGFEVFNDIYKSVNKDQYNDFIALPIGLISKTLGSEFRYFVFTSYFLYALPVAFLCSNLIIVFKNKKEKIDLIAPFLILFFVPLLLPIRFGFPDIAGLVPICIILNLFFKKPLFEKIDVKRFLFIGILLLIVLFSRRWYTFWVLSFFIINFTLLSFHSFYKKDYKIFIIGCINLGISFCVFLILMLTFFFPFFQLTFLTDYRDIYSGYRMRDWDEHFASFFRRFGYSIIIIMILGVYGYLQKKLYYPIAYLLFSVLLIFGTFITFNDFGPQHYYLVIIFIILINLGTFFILKKSLKIFAITLFVILIFAGFYGNILSKGTFFSNNFFIKSNAYRIDRPDFDQIQEIMDDVIKHYNEGNYTYCLSNSPDLNYSLLQNVKLPQRIKASDGLLKSQNVDKRDSFPNDLFISKYILVTNPVQVHLNPKDQELIVFFNEEFKNGRFKNYFKIIKHYSLANNIKVTLLEKTKGFSSTDIDFIQNHFKKLYPDYPNMYDINQNFIRLNTMFKGDNYGKVLFTQDDRIEFQPGSTKNSKISFNTEGLKSFNFTATFKNKNDVIKNCNPDKDAEINLLIKTDSLIIGDFYITHKKDTTFTIPLNNINTLNLEVNKGKYEDYCDWFILDKIKFN